MMNRQEVKFILVVNDNLFFGPGTEDEAAAMADHFVRSGSTVAMKAIYPLGDNDES